MDANGTRFHLLLGKTDWASLSELFITESTGVEQTHPLEKLWTGQVSPKIEPGVTWETERNELTLRPLIFRFKQLVAPPSQVQQRLQPTDRRGAAADQFGNWYWIDSSRNKIMVLSSGSGNTTTFWYPSIGELAIPLAPTKDGSFAAKTVVSPLPLLMSGLTVTNDHYLVVGILKTNTSAAGLLIFDLHANGEPELLVWPDEVNFAPFDMAASPCGGVWILDRDNKRYWKLDRQFNVIRHTPQQDETALPPPDTFQPKTPPTEQPRRLESVGFPQGLRLDEAANPVIGDPVAIEALPDDTMLILDGVGEAGFTRVLRYHFGALQPDTDDVYSTQKIQDQIEGLTSLIGHDFAFVAYDDSDPNADPKVDRLYITSDDGNQSFVFHFYHPQNTDGTIDTVHINFEPLPIYLPMQLFGGKALVAAGNHAYYDVGDRWLPLVEQRRPRYVSEAILETSLDAPDVAKLNGSRPALDGLEPDCVWHRLLLDACIPSDTLVEVWSRAANDLETLTTADWFAEPRPYQRGDGSELPFARTGYDTYELLLQRAVGRYLQLRLRLSGNGRVTPRLRSLRVYYPRFSYLVNYLPAVFRQDHQSASFVDRFLANLEGFFTALEDKIAVAQMLIDTRSASAESLDWLASWFGVALHPAWDDYRRRLFIRYAMRFFQARGTLHGLQWALRLALNECVNEHMFDQLNDDDNSRIRIIERFRTRQLPGVLIGDPTDTGAIVASSTVSAWQPTDGGIALNQRYFEALINNVSTDLSKEEQDAAKKQITDTFSSYPIQDPGGALSAFWQAFSAQNLGFVPAGISQTRVKAWREFLERRYQTINTLNTDYGSDETTFSTINPPTTLPPDGPQLLNWYQFERFITPALRTAHQFTVLLPAPIGDARLQVTDIQDRLDLAAQIIDLEKPAHTVYEIKYYWAMFRLGETRLGIDTLVDVGSRAPELMTPAILGRSYLSESYLAPRHPYNVLTRRVVGRDRIAVKPGEQSL